MKHRRVFVVISTLIAFCVWLLVTNPTKPFAAQDQTSSNGAQTITKPISAGNINLAQPALDTLEVKGRAPKTNYSRAQFGDGWESINGCDTRNRILVRDLENETVSDDCKVLTGTLNDPYTGTSISFTRGATTSALIQIDHVVALSNAWQTGAQQLTEGRRIELANDPLELLAVDGEANQKKSDGDAATWLPANKSFRCQYVARQIAVKAKYALWVTTAEKQAMQTILQNCPDEPLPSAVLK